MGYKRFTVSLEENLLKDMDSLIKAGFYRNRPELITAALFKIDPIKRLSDKRYLVRLSKIAIKTGESLSEVIHASTKVPAKQIDTSFKCPKCEENKIQTIIDVKDKPDVAKCPICKTEYPRLH